jgi:hypothetical protein
VQTYFAGACLQAECKGLQIVCSISMDIGMLQHVLAAPLAFRSCLQHVQLAAKFNKAEMKQDASYIM